MKIKVRIAKYTFMGYPLSFNHIELECNGAGTKADPAIIDSFSDLKVNVEILESDLYITIKNCVMCFLDIYYSKNVSIQGCTLRTLDLRACSNIQVENIKCSWLKMSNCTDCSLFDSESREETIIYKSFNNYFKRWNFGNFLFNPDGLSRNNVLEDCEIFDLGLEEVKQLQEPISEFVNSLPINCYSPLKGYVAPEVICLGKGTKDDPFVIDSLDIIPFKVKRIELCHVRDYIVLKNIKIKSLRLYDVRFFKLEQSECKDSILLKFCSDIQLNSTNSKKLQLGGCENVHIVNSTFNKIESLKGLLSHINLKNVIYKQIDKKLL